jgi:hypothetical protein
VLNSVGKGEKGSGCGGVEELLSEEGLWLINAGGQGDGLIRSFPAPLARTNDNPTLSQTNGHSNGGRPM